MATDLTILGRTTYRNEGRRFGIRQADRLSHLYVVGKTGTGKTTLLEGMARQDVAAGRGLALLDPHGDLADRLAAAVPPERRPGLVRLDVPDPAQPYGYNPLRRVPEALVPLAAAGLLDVFRKQWPEYWGVRMEHILRNAVLALLEADRADLGDLVRLCRDAGYRRTLARRLGNPVVRRFWLEEFEAYPPRLRAEAVVPIQNRVGALLAVPLLRRILTEAPEPVRLRRLMDSGGILLVNLARGRIGSDVAGLLGSLLLTSLSLAAFSRADAPEAARRPFHVYVDEFHAFTTLALADMAAELRKYRVGLVLAHQYLGQLDDAVREAVLGNAGTAVLFRLGADDAARLAAGFAPFGTDDLANLPNRHFYLRLMVDGAPSRAFSAETLAPDEAVGAGRRGGAPEDVLR